MCVTVCASAYACGPCGGRVCACVSGLGGGSEEQRQDSTAHTSFRICIFVMRQWQVCDGVTRVLKMKHIAYASSAQI